MNGVLGITLNCGERCPAGKMSAGPIEDTAMSSPFDALRGFYSQALRPLHENLEQAADTAVTAAGDLGDALHDVGEALGEGAADVASAVAQAGVGNVAANLVGHGATQTATILSELAQRSPAQFVEWLAGPEGPSFADATAQVPGLQVAIGNVIDRSMENPIVAGAVGRAFGFEYVPQGDFYTTNEHSLQSMTGFHDLYDKVGDLFGMDLTEEVVEFEHDGVEYRLEFWQGSYGSGGAFGGEIGLYTRGTGARGPLGDLLEQVPGYYSAAAGDDQIVMTQTIYNTATGQEYFTNAHAGADDDAHFWNLAIRTDPGVNHEDIGQRGVLELQDPELAQAMHAAMVADGMDAQLHSDGTTITYDWP